MTEKVQAFQDPKNPRRIIIQSSRGYKSSFLIISKDGEVQVIEEIAMVNVHRMEYSDVVGLASHRRWARSIAEKKAKQLAIQGQFSLSTT